MRARKVGQRARQDVSFGDAAERYLQSRRLIGIKPGTLEDYESYLRVHLLPAFGSMPLDGITADDVDAFVAQKQLEHKARKSILNYLGLMHAICAHAQKRGWCSHNVMLTVDKPRNQRTPEIRYLTVGELERLLAAVPETALGGVERVLYLTAAMTGLRRGELLALRWQDVDLPSGVVRVRRTYTRGRFGTPKTRRSFRTVPLAGRVQTELGRLRASSRFDSDDDLVFAHPESGRVLDPYRMRRRFIAATGRAGLRHVRFHDLRHTYGTRLAAAGAPLRAIQEWLGHSDYRTTSIYADYAPDASQGARWAELAFDRHDS